MTRLYIGKPPKNVFEWITKHDLFKIILLDKKDIESFTLQEEQIVKVLNNPAIDLNNTSIEDIINSFQQIVSIFPADSDISNIHTVEDIKNAMEMYIIEKNKSLNKGK